MIALHMRFVRDIKTVVSRTAIIASRNGSDA
jgi:hypothetical protein